MTSFHKCKEFKNKIRKEKRTQGHGMTFGHGERTTNNEKRNNR